jgi:hypothetical protein
MDQLAGKTAVVTGAASGIGRAMATRFATEGMNVVLADIEAPALEATVNELQATGSAVLGVRTDVTDSDSVEALAAQAKKGIVCVRSSRVTTGQVGRDVEVNDPAKLLSHECHETPKVGVSDEGCGGGIFEKFVKDKRPDRFQGLRALVLRVGQSFCYRRPLRRRVAPALARVGDLHGLLARCPPDEGIYLVEGDFPVGKRSTLFIVPCPCGFDDLGGQ